MMNESYPTETTRPVSMEWIFQPYILRFDLIIWIVVLLLFNVAGNLLYVVILFGFILITLLSMPFGVLVRYLDRKYLFYKISPDLIWLKRGIINRTEKNIPFTRIQNVVIRRSLKDVCMDLATVMIENAASSGLVITQIDATYSNMVLIPGLKYSDAIYIRNEVLKNFKQSNRKSDSNTGV